MATRPMIFFLFSLLPLTVSARCCFYPESDDRCGSCESFAEDSNFCAGSQSQCENDCGHIWCDDEDATSAPTTETPAPTIEATVIDSAWVSGTYTTGYWDCCKPSCSWPGKGNVDTPIRSCEAQTGSFLDDPNIASVCDGGTSASCTDNKPFDVEDGLSMGFAAAAVGGVAGLNGDENCGQCFELVWTDDQFSWGGGANPSIVGNRHVIQVTNIGYDVSGDHSFDLQIPGAGQGIFDNGCVAQFSNDETSFTVGDFDCDNNYGGCDDVQGCSRLPVELQEGCEWRYSHSYMWLQDSGRTNNPYSRFRRVKCPSELVAITGSTPLDDDSYPEITRLGSTPASPTTSPIVSPTASPIASPTASPTASTVSSPTASTVTSPTIDLEEFCIDSTTWAFKKKPEKGCSWVAKKPDKRCKKKSVVKVRAWDECIAACAEECADEETRRNLRH